MVSHVMDKINYFDEFNVFDMLIVMRYNFLLNQLVLFVDCVCSGMLDNLAFSFFNILWKGIIHKLYDHN